MRAKARRRAALGLLATAAITGGISVIGVPAYAQAVGVGNSGGASAGTGGNQSVGNSSGNSAVGATSLAGPAQQSLVGGLVGLVLNVGGVSNASTGTSAINTGGAAATGNVANTTVSQTGGGSGVIGTVFSPFAPAQSAGVSNVGEAQASTGGNQSVGNDSTNTAVLTQTVSGGLIGVGINLGSVSNTSSGTSTITTGPAEATGNESTTAVQQARVGDTFGVGGGVLCDGGFRFGGQRVQVDNSGSALASTGNNASVGNQSVNEARSDLLIGGGLLNANVGLGGVSNLSDGASAINTGPASAAGNVSNTAVSQFDDCVQPVAHFVAHGPPVLTPTFLQVIGTPVAHGAPQLARTGVDPFVMGLVAFSLLFGGLLLLVWDRVEALPAGAGRRIA